MLLPGISNQHLKHHRSLMPIEPIIRIKNVRVIYNQGKSNEMRALEETNLDIYPEEYVIIYGPSGCGKSTLLYSIAGLQSPTYGEVLFHDKSLSGMTQRETLAYHQIGTGMIFQAFYLITSLNVIDNVCIPQTFMGTLPKDRHPKGFHLLRRFGIAEQAEKFPNQLSGGQKQRVAIARALINNPEIILADEPVGNLDSESSQNVLDILKELNETDKKTVVMVTHNPEHLVYADRIIYMKDGRIVNEEVRNDKRDPSKRVEKTRAVPTTEISPELKVLMDSFKNLMPQQVNILLVPFKAKQLLHYTLSNLSDEQTSMAEAFLRELLFKNLTAEDFTQKLDIPLEKGGAGWNKKRAQSFSEIIRTILEQVENIKAAPDTAQVLLARYFGEKYNLRLEPSSDMRFQNVLRMRLDNKINHSDLLQKLDQKPYMGGVGLHRLKAEKIVREMEVFMLLKYS